MSDTEVPYDDTADDATHQPPDDGGDNDHAVGEQELDIEAPEADAYDQQHVVDVDPDDDYR